MTDNLAKKAFKTVALGTLLLAVTTYVSTQDRLHQKASVQ